MPPTPESVITGWAKGDAATFRPQEENRKFSLIATFLDAEGNDIGESFTANFNPDVNTTVAWQYTTGRFLNADALTSTGQGELGNNMFAYCSNNPILFADPSGTCAIFWGFKLYDCKKVTCSDSENYNPDAPVVVVFYDSRFSGYFGLGGDGGSSIRGKS